MREMLKQTLVNLAPEIAPEQIDALTAAELETLINEVLRRA